MECGGMSVECGVWSVECGVDNFPLSTFHFQLPTVAVVAEYNPFHNGHFYQIRKIKERFPEAAVVSVMSGSLVQRGDVALFSKYRRAEMAVLCGVDAVFELPSVYANASANIFAHSAVWILEKLSGIDYICFGSECGELEPLEFAAEKIMGEDFSSKLSKTVKANKNKSYAANVHELFCAMYGEKKASVLLGSNNILAIEYLKALKKLGSRITPFTVKREGAPFNSETFDKTAASASYIRKTIRENSTLHTPHSTLTCMPAPAHKIAAELIGEKKFTDIENLAPAVITHLSRLGADEIAAAAEITGGLEHRIKKSIDGCFDLATLFRRLCAKHTSPSAVRRGVLSAFFGITKETQGAPPGFTAVLAINQKGAGFISSIRKKAAIKIATKPAHMKESPAFDKNCFIDNTCKLALHDRGGEINEMRQKPRLIRPL